MKPIAILGAGLVALASGSSGYHATTPRPPQPPKPPSMPQAEPFKPFHGTHVDSKRGGVDAFPHAPKPKGGMSTY